MCTKKASSLPLNMRGTQEESMKRTYAAPCLINSGTVVSETLGGPVSGPEGQIKEPLSAGSVGFYL